MALKLVSLEIKDSRINFVKKYDFQNLTTGEPQELLVKQSEAVVILQNILNFVSVATKNSQSTLETTAELQVDNDNLKIYKSYASAQVQYFVNDQPQQLDVYAWLSEKLKIKLDPPTWESRLVDFQKLEINTFEDLKKLFNSKDSMLQNDLAIFTQKNTLNAQFEQLKSQSVQGMTPEQVQKIDRLRDVKFRINKIQKEVDSYQNQKEDKDKFEKQIKDKDQEFNILKDKLESVTSLMQARKQIEAEMQKYGNVVQQDADVRNLRQSRVNQTSQFLQTAYTKPARKSINQDEEEKGFNLSTKKIVLIAQIPLTLILVLVAYLLINQSIILLLGVIVIILEFSFIIFEFNSKTKTTGETEALFQAEVPQVNTAVLPGDNSQDQIFINQAWKSAYLQELTRIDQLMSTNLSGKTYEEVMQQKTNLENELNALKAQQESNNANSLDSESYYKKRRELDILKIEKENLEFDANLQIPNESQLDSLNQQLIEIEDQIDSLEDVKSSIPFVVINVKESIREFIAQLAARRQIVLISNEK